MKGTYSRVKGSAIQMIGTLARWKELELKWTAHRQRWKDLTDRWIGLTTWKFTLSARKKQRHSLDRPPGTLPRAPPLQGTNTANQKTSLTSNGWNTAWLALQPMSTARKRMCRGTVSDPLWSVAVWVVRRDSNVSKVMTKIDNLRD